MRTRLFMLLAALLCATTVSAQTTSVLVWDYDAPQADVATYTQAVAIDGAAQTGAPACTAHASNPQQTTCRLTITALAAGPHTISVTASRGGMTAETRVTGVNPANIPRNALNPRVNVTVVVTIP